MGQRRARPVPTEYLGAAARLAVVSVAEQHERTEPLVSTIKRLGGKQYNAMRDNRKAALAFYRDKTRLPGVAGAIAAEIYRTLYTIHRDPALNSPSKNHEFRSIIRRFASGDRSGVRRLQPATSPEEAVRVAGLSAIEGVPATDE